MSRMRDQIHADIDKIASDSYVASQNRGGLGAGPGTGAERGRSR